MQQLEGISQLVELCEEPLFADFLQEIPDSFVPWSGQRTLAAVSPLLRNNLYLSPPPNALDDGTQYEATLVTSDGSMTFELYANEAPLAVNNFVSLSRDGFYDGLTFHRVLEGFMAQGGDPTGIGTGSPGYRFEDEVNPNLYLTLVAFSQWRTQAPTQTEASSLSPSFPHHTLMETTRYLENSLTEIPCCPLST